MVKKGLGVSFEIVPVRDVPVQIGEGQLFGFDDMVEVLGGVVTHARHIESVQDLQHLQSCDSLARRGKLPNLVSLEIHREGLHPLHLMVPKVIHGEESSLGLDRLHDRFPQGSPVEGRRPLPGHHPVGRGQVRVSEPLSCFRSPAPLQKVGGAGAGIPGEDPDVASPLAGDDGCYGESVFSDLYGRSKGLGQGEGPVLVQEGGPT